MMRFKKPTTIFMALLFVCMAFTTSCEVDRYNALTDKSKDHRAKDSRVYGDGKGQPARQTKQTYPDPADGQARADAVKEKFYGKSGGNAPAPAKADTTKADKKENKGEPQKPAGEEKKM